MRKIYFILMLLFTLTTLVCGAMIDQSEMIILLFLFSTLVTCAFFILWKESEKNKYFTTKMGSITYVGKMEDKKDYYPFIKEFKTRKDAEQYANQQNRR